MLVNKYLDVKTRILVYKQTILPLVEYISFMLLINRKHDTDELQNRTLRLCYNINNPIDIGIIRIDNSRNGVIHISLNYCSPPLFFKFLFLFRHEKSNMLVSMLCLDALLWVNTNII